jgi:Smg protein
MKENVFDVLIYLFENYMDEEVDPAADADAIRTDLLEAGFPNKEISKAFDWLESLAEQKPIQSISLPAFRVFSEQECVKLDTECRGLLMYLEQSGILTPASRELVIDRAMALQDEAIALENLKWIVLMVLFSQPDEEIAFARMENLVYESLPSYMH